MIPIQLNFQGRIINAITVESQMNDGSLKIQVSLPVEDPICKEIDNPIFFKESNNILSYLEISEKTQGETAVIFLVTFKEALDWLRNK